MTKSLILSQLTKTYAGTPALRDVALEVAPGERVALLGHNGAGKSTMMKIILGLIPYDSGQIEVLGAAPGSTGARAHVAYLPENVAFHPALSGLEQIRHFLRLRGLPASGAIDLLARVGLADAAKRRIGTYSKGMRQRIGLAQALIGQPRLLVLDEPTSGLDPVSRRDFYTLLDGLAADGAAILLSSHALTEVEARTDRLVILSQGRVVAQGTLPDLRRAANLSVTLHVIPQAGAEGKLAAALPQGHMNGTGLHLDVTQNDKLPVLSQITALKDLVADIEITPPSLEDIYSHYSRRDGQ
ncbi:Cu-processing system ATP-binding protein [Roseovarius nanhaiticus]|uniref:Cu-processing system ATP-binding protein n=1 Tax=Roseovarius nanhaiticus TaxID=573024 RepID=A0A1N7HBJ4_9RHOB|nr:ABC transporter ATP-binding protein [Roseovarius nanhaiticus]SEL04866.1 Cu-processing system ATP-binding protein [Roseovarius nanhaiticus]SIS22153.1 Cu-processing system ATP-binding protein [Roseovarius nanhaiticus]